jgi:triosephosphate isomerase (TIM)
MQAQRAVIAANWKMNKTIAESVAYIQALRGLNPDLDGIDAVIFPPFTVMRFVSDALAGTKFAVGGQAMSEEDRGSFTGEISALQLQDAGATWAILGHSERRGGDGETDESVNRKVHAALRWGIRPIVCVGESEADHHAGITHTHVLAQTRAAFEDVAPEGVAQCLVAYEPIWAIGSGSSDTPESANAVLHTIRTSVPGLERAQLLYGGSVKASNIGTFLDQPNIDGALVGNASLDPRSFADVLSAASHNHVQ